MTFLRERSTLIYSCLQQIEKTGLSVELPSFDSIGLTVRLNRAGEVYLTLHEPKLSSVEWGEEISGCSDEMLPDILASQLETLAEYCRELAGNLLNYATTLEEERKKLLSREGMRSHLMNCNGHAKENIEENKQIVEVIPRIVKDKEKKSSVPRYKPDLDIFS